MIKEHCFTDEWLQGFKKQKDHRRIDLFAQKTAEVFFVQTFGNET